MPDPASNPLSGLMSGVTLVGAWYLGLNAGAFLLFLWDKRAARRGSPRIRERSLLSLAWLGGFAGAFVGMRLARHKTRKLWFRVTPVLALAFHGALWWMLLR